MASDIFQFGDVRPEFRIPVLNERAVRAAAGLLLFFALISFMNAWLTGNFQPTRVFVVIFLIEFSIRVFINPRFAPVLIVGQWAVRKQQPEWTGAPQKRFAWAIGWALAAVMAWLVVLNQVIGPINMVVCVLCLTLLFFEAAFGICIGCKVYNLLNKEKAQLCPGGLCAVPANQVPSLSAAQVAMVVAFGLAIVGVSQWVYRTAALTPRGGAAVESAQRAAPTDPAEIERCKVPAFAKAIGHEEKWKLHNHCQ